MEEVVYYILEAVKFLMIYVSGLSMKLTANPYRRIAACCLVVLTGVLMNDRNLRPVYPLLYTLFAILLFYLLIEQATWRRVLIVFWTMGVVLSVNTISSVLTRIFLRVTHNQLNQWQDLYASMITIVVLAVIFGLMLHNQKTALQELSVWHAIVLLLICIVNACLFTLIERMLPVYGEFAEIYIMLVLSSLVQTAFVYKVILKYVQ